MRTFRVIAERRLDPVSYSADQLFQMLRAWSAPAPDAFVEWVGSARAGEIRWYFAVGGYVVCEGEAA